MHRLLGMAGLAAGTVVALSSAAEAGLMYVQQQREIETFVGVGNLLESIAAGDPRSAVTVQDSAEFAAPDFGPVDEEVESVFTDGGDEDTQRARARLTSRLGETSMTASGEVGAFSDDEVAYARSVFDVTFDLSESAAFSLDLDLALPVVRPNTLALDRGLLRLTSVGQDGGASATVFEDTITEEELLAIADDAPFALSEAGDLAAGRYRLQFELAALAPNHSAESFDYDLQFQTADEDTGGGGETPIPLPPAAWAGLGTFACYGASRLLGRRFRRA